jgi:dihydroorotate dehydrogenase electron transfer subunit
MDAAADLKLPGLVPDASQQTARVVEQVRMARDTYRLRLECPELARRIVPGQFFMVREPGCNDPLLGRPFALYDTVHDSNGEPTGIDFGYVVIGKLTGRMTDWKPDDPVEIWGPLGNGFPEPPEGHLVMVAGGIGQTPFLAVTREALGHRQYGDQTRVVPSPPPRLTMCYGVRSVDYLAGVDDFSDPGLQMRISTDDGSHGHHGLVTQLLEDLYRDGTKPTAIYTCGPEPMMAAVARVAAQHKTPCWASLETPMACGFGICFSCVTRVRVGDGQWDYRRTCVEGPVFRAEQLHW